MLFLQAAGGVAALGFKKPGGAWVRPPAIDTAYLAQDCQRRQSQASIEPVWVTLCFLVKNMRVCSVCGDVVRTYQGGRF
jgi:hypothetical protein